MLTQESIKETLKQCLGLEAEIIENKIKVINAISGYLTPVNEIELQNGNLIIKSSPLTNTEWWQTFIPVSLCPRFMGVLEIDDEYKEYCKEKRCEEACQAEDDFVELKASRLRLNEDYEIISKKFPRLNLFIERTKRIIDETNTANNTKIELCINTNTPYLITTIPNDNEKLLCDNLKAFQTIYEQSTGITSKIDISEIPSMDTDFDPLDEETILDEIRYYAMIEMVKEESKVLLEKLIKNKNGKIEGKFYLIDSENLRYILYPNRIEAFKNELYKGTVYFNKGLNEVKNYLITILGGGVW